MSVYIIFVAVIAVLLLLLVFNYVRTAVTLKKINLMLDDAINNAFSESDFTESQLSRIEAKLCRYLSAGKTVRKRLEEERNAVKTLVSDISHQTKTPVSNIMLYSNLLSEQSDMSTASKELLSHIAEQTEKLDFLLQSLVKVSRLENGTIKITAHENGIVKLFEMLDYKHAAEKKGVDFTLQSAGGLRAVFDLKWTAEAVSNIMDNAVKYTSAGGSVTVSAMDYEMFVRIDVADTGIGISEADTAKIFARFYRASDVSNEKGVGIGLYLAREILSKEGGYIKVTSEKGKGSVFSVFLPKTINLSKL